MDELLNGLVSKVGLDRATADKVVAFLKENSSRLPQWLSSSDLAKGVVDKLPGGLGSLLGGK